MPKALRLAVVVCLLWTAAAQAQLITGTITGTVADPSNAVVSQVEVRLIESRTGVMRATTTGSDGDFAFRQLPPGTYMLEVAAQGFKTFQRAGIVVEADRSLAVPARLEVGSLSETITVEAGTPLLEPNTSSLGTVMDQRKVEELPLNGRNPMGLANLIPTVRGIGYFGGQELSTWRASAVNIAGGSPLTQGYLIDGIANDKLGDSGTLGLLTVDATQEFKVLTNSMSAEFGRTSGGIISVISKSGTNEFHGNVFEYFRNDKLNANEFFANRSGQERPSLKFNQFGGALGGPIRRDRLFFFVNYEEFRERRAAQRIVNSATPEQRAGDFSDTRVSNGNLIQVHDPLTTSPGATAGRFVREPFANNTIPASRISPFARAVLDYYPLPNLPGLPVTRAQNSFQQSVVPVDRPTFTAKLDWNISAARRLSGRYTLGRLDWGFANYFNNIADDDGRHILIPRDGISLNYNDTISPTLLLDAKLGFNRDNEHWTVPGGGFDVTTLGLPASLVAQAQSGRGDTGFPNIAATDLSPWGRPDAAGNPGDTINGGVSMTKIQSSHTLKFGFDHRVYRRNSWGTNNPHGSYTFTRGFTQGPDAQQASATSGHGVASLLLGNPASGSAGWSTDTTRSLRMQALFLQDDWKVTRKLTLNLGVRWETERPVRDRHNVLSNFDPAIDSPLQVPGLDLKGGLVFPGVGGLDRSLTIQSWNDVAPRFGFAYQAAERLVVRGGYGISYLPSTFTGPASGFSITTPMVTSIDGGVTQLPGFSLSNPYPDGINQPEGSNLGALTLVGQGVSGQLRDVQRGYAQQWNLTLQVEPWSNWLFEAAWVGNHGTRLGMTQQLNYLSEAALALGTQLSQSVPNPFNGIISGGTLSGATVTQQQLLMPFPQFTGVNGGTVFRGNSIYHALAMKVEKRFSSGLSMLLAYTASKLIDDGGSSGRPAGNSSTGAQNWNDLRAERSKGVEDIPQRLVTTLLWEVPLGRTGSALTRHVLGGWQVNAIGTLQSGPTLSPSASVTGGGNRPNVAPGVSARLDNPTLEQWFNTDAFSVPAPYTFGTSSRTMPNVHGDGMFNIDLSLFKSFPIRERARVEFRVETFNITNTPTFERPNLNSTSNTFGVVTATAFNPKPREVQFALRFIF